MAAEVIAIVIVMISNRKNSNNESCNNTRNDHRTCNIHDHDAGRLLPCRQSSHQLLFRPLIGQGLLLSPAPATASRVVAKQEEDADVAIGVSEPEEDAEEEHAEAEVAEPEEHALVVAEQEDD